MKMSVKGALIASAVAGLLATTACGTPTSTATGQIKCEGINSCTGKGECAAADGSHDCAGKNSCTGKGWVKTTEADCTSKGGKNLGPA
ncbi:MAG: hypothetical protein H6728_16320 [Myxococcales bacterium]|nr:hypothetical protein [Myxococcales bacterium]MCB9644640.1 hypothetical protein [Myxococcales bacterium]